MLPELSRIENFEKKGRTVKWLEHAFNVAEMIASRDHNNLYITSSFFKDSNKYKVFCTYYAVMRIVDDRIDNLPPSDYRSKNLQNRELAVVNAWEQVVDLCCRGIKPCISQFNACEYANAEEICESLITAFQIIPVPIKLWTNFFEAMRSDIKANTFNTWSDFLSYAKGATVAPTTIYMLLITARPKKTNNLYEWPSELNIHQCGFTLGLFAYLGHIIRDLAKDITAGATRICITPEDMLTHDVSLEILKNDVLNSKASKSTRSLVKDLVQRARYYLFQGRYLISKIQDFLESDSRFILELIITIYEQVIAKIELTGYDPMSKKHCLSTSEKTEIVKSVASRNGFLLPIWFENSL